MPPFRVQVHLLNTVYIGEEVSSREPVLNLNTVQGGSKLGCSLVLTLVLLSNSLQVRSSMIRPFQVEELLPELGQFMEYFVC